MAYFKKCEEAEKLPTVSGLALALGLNSRQTLWNYAHGDAHKEYHEVAQRMFLMLEEPWESSLSAPNPAGKIFWLCNRANGSVNFEQTSRVMSHVDANHHVSGVKVQLVRADDPAS